MTMLTGDQLAKRFVEEHPGGNLTRNAIKTLLRGGCIPSVRAGNRVFYNLESFERFLNEGNSAPDAEERAGIIRRIM